MRGEFVDVGGCRLYYYASGTRGAGEPLVLVHGAATSAHLWSKLIPYLPGGHRVVVLDLLGHGRSDDGAGFDRSALGHAARLLRLMDSLGIARAAIIGHGFGGMVAQALTRGSPDRVSRLCLVNSAALTEPTPLRVRIVGGVAPLLRYVPPRASLRIIERSLLRGYSDPASGGHSIDQYLRPFISAEGLAALAEQLLALDGGPEGRRQSGTHDISAPTAIVLGEDDPFLARGAAARLQASIPSATLDYIPDARHFIPEETPEQLSRIVVSLMHR